MNIKWIQRGNKLPGWLTRKILRLLHAASTSDACNMPFFLDDEGEVWADIWPWIRRQRTMCTSLVAHARYLCVINFVLPRLVGGFNPTRPSVYQLWIISPCIGLEHLKNNIKNIQKRKHIDIYIYIHIITSKNWNHRSQSVGNWCISICVRIYHLQTTPTSLG